MLEKFVQIKSIGRFRNYAATGDVSFRKITLMYAENGRGKTTLCAVLRSLQSGQSHFIAERKTLATTDPATAHIRLNGTSYQFANNAWTATHPDLLIFDPVFVNDNVYSGDYVEHEHKKNLYRVIVGAQGVQLAGEIESLDNQIRDANADLRTKKDAVSRELPSGVSIDAYLDWQPIADIDVLIQQKTEELSKRQTAATRSGEIRAKGLFQQVQLPSVPADFTQVLAKQLTDVTADAEAKVRGQVTQHQMSHQGESWLAQGLSYVVQNLCPFCGQDLRSSDLITVYRTYFNEAYRNLKREVSQLSQRIGTAIGTTSLSPLQQVITSNGALSEFWRQFRLFVLNCTDLRS